ncbi:phage tail protein [Krasilnikovia sp. MM14-A1259]|uniref:phage tail protein n=1 Tax=Krasilnikovia sp. MM14-A1259 TaxID=3373539 RepID=UPI003810ACB6
MADAHTMDPPFVGKFTLEIGASVIGSFTEVSGLSVQLDVEELAEGGQNAYTHKLLGRMKWPNLVLKRGLTDTDALFEWVMQCSGEGLTDKHNKVTPRNGKISVLNAAGQSVRTWTILEAKPVKWTGPRFAASSRDLAIEELEVCHSGFRSGK